jgi:type IV secretory pathway VirB10-like protein
MIGVWARNLLITVGAVLLVCAGLYLCFVTPHHRSAPPESAVGLLDRADMLAWGNRWADARPLYQKAEMAFLKEHRPDRALYAQVSQIPADETGSVEEKILQLRKDLIRPEAKNEATYLRILTIRGMLETNYDAGAARSTWQEIQRLAFKKGQVQLATRAVGEQGTSAAVPQTEAAEDLEPKAASADAGNGSQGKSDSIANAIRNVSASQPRKDAMGSYDFDGYQGRLYRVFEGTVFEGIVTNHVDGSLAGPMIVMLTTDYYSHDHQELLLPQGTRLIGNVQSVNSGGQRKLLVVFNRAVCPDGFSLDLNKFMGLDPLGTSGLATNVNNHYLSSFAAAAAVGGIGGLAQVGNSGSLLDSSTQIRNGISAQTAAESEQILNKFLNRLPTITVKEGTRARIYINQDLLIPSYAEHRVDPTL